MMAVEEWSYPDTVFSCDACLEGLGGMFEDHFFHAIFPSFITEQNLHINCLELLTIVVSLRKWGKYMTRKRNLDFCDNEASVQVLISGHTRDAFMQNCLKEKAMVLTSQCENLNDSK